MYVFYKALFLLLCKAKECKWYFANSLSLNGRTYPYKNIEAKCADGFIPSDRRLSMSVICGYNEDTQEFEWNKRNYAECIENSCEPHKDFMWIREDIRKNSYAIGEEVRYTCPGGYRLRTICVIDPNTGFGVWDFSGSCSGKT